MNYYNYLLALESKFQAISIYVEIDERNYKTFSTEISLIYLATCSEFEVVAKELCEILEPGFKTINYRANITKITEVILRHFPAIIDHIVDVKIFERNYNPLVDWRIDKAPNWWIDYNFVKHNRAQNYHLAHLENLLNALSALSIINHYYLWKKKCPNGSINTVASHLNNLPKYFRIRDTYYEGLKYNTDFDI